MSTEHRIHHLEQQVALLIEAIEGFHKGIVLTMQAIRKREGYWEKKFKDKEKEG